MSAARPAPGAPAATPHAAVDALPEPVATPAPAPGDPRYRLGMVACVGVLALCLEGAPALAAVALPAALLALAQPRMAGWRLRFLAALALLVWSTALSQGLFYAVPPRTPLVVLLDRPPVAIWREGVVHGLVQSLRFVAVLGAGLALALSTSPDRLLAALLALRVPYGLALMGATAVRFLPLVGAELVAVRQARARRGRPIWDRSPWAWLRLEAALLRPVLARAIRRARALAESLETRGFHPTAPRAVVTPMRATLAERVGLWTLVVVSGAAVVARVLYALYGAELLYVPALRGLYAFVRAYL